MSGGELHGFGLAQVQVQPWGRSSARCVGLTVGAEQRCSRAEVVDIGRFRAVCALAGKVPTGGAAMPTEQERKQFLSDVRHAAGLPATATLQWDENLEAMAQVAAMGRYPPDEAPVWARDSELTAAHLARRRTSMDEWDYHNIVYELARLLVAADHEDCRAEPSEAAYLRGVECDDSNIDATSDQLSSRASEVSELSDVFETVDEQIVGAETAASAQSPFSLGELQKLAADGQLQHLIVDDKLVEAVTDLTRDEALAFLGLDSSD